MADGVVIQFAVFSVLAAVMLGALVAYKRRKAVRAVPTQVHQARVVVEKSERMPPQPMQFSAPRPRPDAEPPAVQTITVEVKPRNEPPKTAVIAPQISEEKLPVVLHSQPVTIKEDRNQRILADISANIQKSLIKPVPTYSPVQYPEAPRETEYVRVKKQIITPHGQVRFSILKDSISTNMLAVLRRASLEWKTPDDLIGFLPAYLEPEAEILNDQVLLIGTPGHNEKLAIPIRSVDSESSLRNCFDFVTDVRTATNTPAVLLASDEEFEVVSRGVITQPAFMNRSEKRHADVKLLVEKSVEVLQAN